MEKTEIFNGKRFWGYTSLSWDGDCIDKKDPNAFIFSLDKIETYGLFWTKMHLDVIQIFGLFFLDVR